MHDCFISFRKKWCLREASVVFIIEEMGVYNQMFQKNDHYETIEIESN